MLLYVFVSAFVVWLVYQRFFHPLSKYPGPLLATYTNAWKLWHVVSGDYEQQLLRLHQTHGHFVRIGPDHVDVSDTNGIHDVLMAGKSFEKSAFYDGFTALRPSSFGTRNEQVHSAKRRYLASSFSFKNITDMEPLVDVCLAKMISRFDKAAADQETIDLAAWIAFLVSDVLGELTFSRSFGLLEKEDKASLPPIKYQMYLGIASGQFPSWIPLINKHLGKLPIEQVRETIKGRQAVKEMAIASIDFRLKHPDPDRKSLLAKMIEEYESGKSDMDIEDVRTEGFSMINAGMHTTASTLTFLFWQVLHNPAVQAKLEQELLATLGTIPTRDALESCVPYSAIIDLKYLSAVIHETQRLTPAFAVPFMRVVPAAGAVVAGEPLPGGTDVSISNWVLHRTATHVFGPDLHAFVPDRWAVADHHPGAADMGRTLLAFGAGHRACIGRNLALVEICKVVASLLGRYEMSAVDAGDRTGADIPLVSYGVLDLDGPLMVRVKRRP